MIAAKVESVPVGTRIVGVDTDTKLTPASCVALLGGCVSFVIRYLSIGAHQPGDLDAAEVQTILAARWDKDPDAKLGLMAVQHVRNVGWSPTAALGAQDGQAAVANARAAGLLPGLSIWCDLEGCADGTHPQDVEGYINAWYAAVKAGGFTPGLYVGSGCILTSTELYATAPQHYWKSLSDVPGIPHRGYQLIQFLPSITVGGVEYDLDAVLTDYLGGRPIWMVAA